MAFPKTFTDQMQRSVTLPKLPERIISLVPSQTELLFDLGLGDKVVGVTKFCIHPKNQVKRKTKIGGTKNFHFDIIAQHQPDLIIGNKEENFAEGIEKLAEKYPVWMSDIFNLADALNMMQAVGELTGTEEKAERIISEINYQFGSIQPLKNAQKTAYFIWKQPYMAVGNNTFIDDMLQRCGFENVFGSIDRYPEVSPDLLQKLNPELILLSSEPYPFREKHFAEFQKICPNANVKIVDGEMFSWYGSRLLLAAPYLQGLITEIER